MGRACLLACAFEHMLTRIFGRSSEFLAQPIWFSDFEQLERKCRKVREF